VIREAVQKFSESARLPPIDDLYSMRQSSYPVLVLKELCYTALFANPGNTHSGVTRFRKTRLLYQPSFRRYLLHAHHPVSDKVKLSTRATMMSYGLRD
jgi:hypothetical protein